MNKFVRLVNKIFKILVWICLVILVALIVIVSTNVISRYFLKHTFGWVDEVSLFLLSWLSMLTIALGVEMKLHMAIAFIVDKFPKTIQNIINKLSYLLTLVFGIVFLVYGLKLLISGLNATLPATKLPSSTSYLFVPVAGAMIIMTSLVHLFFSDEEYDLETYFLGGKIDGE